MEKDGTMGAEAGAYAGQDRFACRDNLWADIEAAVGFHKCSWGVRSSRMFRSAVIMIKLFSGVYIRI